MLPTLMLVGLGFLAATLIAVLIVPLVWRRAVKVTGRRLQFAAPDSVMEVQADRDQLRAEHALGTRKLELRLQEVKDKLARQAVEHAENLRLIEELREELERKDGEIARRETEIEQLRASMSPIETELASRTHTVQQLRETVRRLEDKAREQEAMIQQTVDAAGLSKEEVEALREASRQEDAGTILLPGLDSTRQTFTEQVGDMARLASEMDIQLAEIFDRQREVETQRNEIASSKTISANEAKTYQSRVSALEAERGKFDADLNDAISRAGRLRQDIADLDQAWQNRDNPYRDLKTRIDGVIADVERISKVLNREGIVKSVLAALPGGRSAARKFEPQALPPVTIVPDPAPKADPALSVPAAPPPAPEPDTIVVPGPEDGEAEASMEAEAEPEVEAKAAPEPEPEAEAKAEPEAAQDDDGTIADRDTDEAPESGPVIRLPETLPVPEPGAEKPAEEGPRETAAKQPEKTRTRTRRARTLADRIRSMQEEIN